jgi:hypothetical protein
MTRLVDPIASELLRRIQAKSIEDQPENADDAEVEAIYRKYASLQVVAKAMAPHVFRRSSAFGGSIDSIISTFSRLPTDLEDPDSYWKLCTLAQAIEECHREDGAGTYHQPLLGTTFSGRLQATIYSSRRTDQKIIVFERELFPIVHHFVELFVSILPFAADENGDSYSYSFEALEITESLLQNVESVTDGLINLLYAYLVMGSSREHGDPFTPFEHKRLATDIEDAVFLLFLGHEYGHLLGEHFSPPPPRDLEADPPLDEHEDARIEEAQADCLSALTAARCFERLGKPIEMVAAAIGIYVILPHVITRAIHALQTGEITDPPPSPTYPTWELRGLTAMNAILQLQVSSGKEHALRSYYKSVTECTLQLLELVLPSLLSGYANGDRPLRRFIWAYE